MKKDFLIEQAKIAAQGEPISRYSDLEWSATSSFLHKFAYLIAKPTREALHQKIISVLESYGVSSGTPGWIRHHCEKRNKVVKDPLSLEGELIFGIEAIIEEFKAQERIKCTKMLEISTSELLLMAGEMTAGEKRTVKAVLKGLAAKMRRGD